ncbi:MAG: hypothetical protein AAGG44_06735, partial [Planctomycetota bacterium]
MSLQNIAWRIFAVVTAMVTGPAAFGQVFHPFGDPLDVDPDWQFFAPVDVAELTEMSPRKRNNTGWFGSYDRTYLWVSRPEYAAAANSGDFGWGNRYDVGFMNEEDRGWLVSFRNIGGPNTYNRNTVTRLDRVNANDTGDPVNNPIVPPEDANDPQLGYRAYVLGQSVNVFGMTNFELNRTWRLSPYRYGGMLEPMLGLKYTTIKDRAFNQAYNNAAAPVIVGGGPTESLDTEITDTFNRMVGGQMGLRYFNHSGRWTLSGEFRAFGMANFQENTYSRSVVRTEYTAVGGTVVATDNNSPGSLLDAQTNSEFVFGFEARAEAAYTITKAFQVRAGVDVMNFAQ